jgi:molybdate transport system ATP-binding protein
MNMFDIRVEKSNGNFNLKASFTCEGSGVTALFGHSGAGKTTLINIIAGLIRPDSGSVMVNGQILFDSQKGINLPPEKRRMGYVFQEGRLFPHLSMKANLLYGMKHLPKHKRVISFDQVVELLGIGHLLSRRPSTLSGGEKQRVAIGRALLSSPSLLLMDEPLASLDASRKHEVLPFLRRLPRELSIPIIYVTHSVDEVLNLADNMVLMDSGSVIALDAIETITTRSEFQSLTGHGGGSVISTAVLSHDKKKKSTHLRFPGGIMKVPFVDIPIETPLRVRIAPRDVAIALEPPIKTSYQNILEARIEKIEQDNWGYMMIHLDIGCPLLARVTPAACADLSLTEGKEVFALVKSVSVSVGKRLVLSELRK